MSRLLRSFLTRSIQMVTSTLLLLLLASPTASWIGTARSPTRSSALDCATTGDVTNDEEIQRVTYTGSKCLLLCVHCTPVTCNEVLVGHPTVTKDCRPIINQTGGKGVYEPSAHQALFCYADAQKAGYQFALEVGTNDNPEHGWRMITPAGDIV
eukprot:3051157-Rhodomonas_salina.1